MGFDNECILNIQSLAGEYFCPVCRLLVYPNEAMQSQCTHLYCKPCLTYVVGTTRACPYDGYLVTEADSKPLTESNKAVADTIGKIAVHCLYHRSGCTWQGQLSECTTHCAGCAFGNSPVVCNRCGTQIVHRQVQDHAQNCPGAQPQTQQAEGSQDATGATTAAATATTEQNQATLQAGAPVSQANTAQVAVAPSSAQNATQVQPSSQPQAVPTQEQLYQQQFQQYYQQYPGYDPYQQQYQHYDPYQQQVYQQQQMQAHIPQAVQGQQPQVYMQAQSQPHQQPQPQLQSQTPIRPQSQPQPQTPIASQPQMQAQVNTHQQLQFAQPHPQMTPQTHPQLQGHQQPQVYPQPHPNVQPPSSQHQVQSHLQPRPQVPQHQQPHPQVQHPHPHTQPHPLPQPQHHSNVQPQPQPPSQSQPQVQPQTQPQPQTQAQPHALPQTQPPPQPLLQAQHPPVHAVTGHQSYPQVHQQMPLGMVQQHPVHMHPQMQVGPQQLPQDTVQMQGQFPLQQLPHMRPPQSHAPMQQQQQPAMFPPQGQRPNMPPSQQLLHPHPHPTSQPIHQHPDMLPSHQQNVAQQQVHGHLVHSQVFPGQAPGLGHTQPPQPNLYMQQQGVQSLPRPQGSAFTLPHAHRQLQQNVPISRGLPHQSQSVAGPPVLSNHAVAHQPFQMPSNGLAHTKLMPSTAVQPYPIRTNSRPQSSALPTSPVPQSGAKAQVSSNMKPELQAEAATQKTDTKDAQGVDLVTTRAENELKSVEGEKSISEDKGKSSHLESDDKEISESSHALEKDPVEKTDEPVIKQMVKDEATTKLDPSTAAKDRDGVLQIKQDHEEPQGQADVHKKLLSQQAEILDGKVQKDVADQQLAHSVSGAVAPSQTVSTSHSVLQNVNLQDRNLFNHQFPHQGIGQMHGSSFPRPGQAVSLPDNQQLSGPPHMLDRNQRPPGPDQMLLPSMAPPHQMQVPGQLSAHMRPQGHNLIPPQGNPSIPPGHFQQPIGKQLPGSFGPSVGSHNQGHMPPPHVAGHRRPSESISGPLFGGQPPGAFDSQGGIMSRGPPHGSEGQQIPGNPMDAELLANGRVGYFDGRQSDSHLPGPRERVPFGQSSSIQAATLKTNGGPGKGMSGGLHDPLFPYLPEERFKSFPLDPGRHIIDRRDFQEDLKQFPRPSHLEGGPGSKFDSFFSSSRPLGLHLDGSAGAGTSRLRPPFQTGGSGPMGVHDDFLRSASDSSRVQMDGLLPIRSPGREFPGIPSSRFLRQEDIEGRGLESRLFGDRSKPLSFPSDGGAFHESRFPMLPSHMHRGDPDGPGSLRISEPIGSSPLPIHLRAGEPLGLRAGLGAFPNHLRSGDVGGPGNLPLNLRIGESIGGHFQPGFGGSIPVHGYPNDGGFFNAGDDHSRKRKVGSMGWCRICKVDCETVEGLDLHSQTRDHQKKAMDMVQNIKKDNAKKQKISSDDNAPQEDTNKSRKASFESRGN